MKSILLYISILIIGTSSCTGLKSSTSSFENEGYIEVVKNSRYRQCVLQIDDMMPIKVKFIRDQYASRPKGKTYAVATGKHEIKIFIRDQLILKKQIFIGAQETRKIILPWKKHLHFLLQQF